MGYSATVLADSLSNAGHRLTTLEVTFPRFVLAEFNTHRMFSRNGASSRAIPVDVMLQKVIDDPVLPLWYGKYQRGMSADTELEGAARDEAERRWLEARDQAVASARALMDIGGPQQGLHKQITNRLLEPWLWMTMIVTATDWSNFFALRCDKDAQPEIRKIAELMRDAVHASRPNPIEVGHWHLPLIRDEDRELDQETLLKVSAARCARVSYLTHDGRRDISADVALHDMLVDNGHMSPLEHQARPMTSRELSGHPRLGNLEGWVQYRKLIPNEADFSRRPLIRVP